MPPSQSTPKEWRSRGYLPHRDRIHLLQSVTFRLADSLPQTKLKALEVELDRLDARDTENDRGVEKRRRIEAYLDAGYGCCALSNEVMAEVMQQALLQFHEERYELIAWCIMPNHVHVVVDPWVKLSKIVQSWKSYTGRWAMQHHAELGFDVPGGADAELVEGAGCGAELELSVPREMKSFWMREYWDRYIRNEAHLEKVVRYIVKNPVKAGLCSKPEDWKWSSAGSSFMGAI